VTSGVFAPGRAGVVRELVSPGQVRAACGDDDLVMWTAQGLAGGARAWALGDAVVAAAPGVARHDRVAVWGGVECAAELVRHALRELGPSYRPFGERGLVAGVAARVGLVVAGTFSWMSLPGPASASVEVDGEVDGEVGWLGGEADGEVEALLAAHAPDSYAVPGAPGVRRWAGLRVAGVLAAVAADAWSAPDVGLLAGVATAAPFRGRGLAGRVCRWVSGELVAGYGRAALMVDDGNRAAIGVYEGLGYRRRLVMAAHAGG
jgi:ribosomal protein S18 acetylase RimI-like enzyme